MTGRATGSTVQPIGNPANRVETFVEAKTADLRRPVLLIGALASIVGARWSLTVGGTADSLSIGLGFGLAILGLAIAAGVRISAPRPLAIVIGGASGLGFVGLSLVGRTVVPGVLPGPDAAVVPWVAITILVASAEELAIRGALFVAVERLAGSIPAVVTTSLVFALMHMPLYGWHVVLLDIGVGLCLGGLRLLTGSVAAPAAAHVVADLATGWI